MTQPIKRLVNLSATVLLAVGGLWAPTASAAARPAAPAARPAAPAAVCAASQAALPCGVGEVSGTIRAGDTGLPLANVGVTSAGYSYFNTTTDANGHYAFQYQIANGPTPITLGVDPIGHYVGIQQNQLFNVVSGTVTTMNFTLTVGSTITGVVHATDVISPLQGVRVVLSPTVLAAGAPPGWRSTQTDANGAYQFVGLAPGSYKVKFDPSWESTFIQSLNHYIPSYFGGAGEAASATTITLTTPTTVTASIVLTPGATIVGDVLAADTLTGLYSYGAFVYSLDQPELGATALRYYSTTTYLVQGLRPGHYRLAVYPNGGDSQPYLGQYYNNQSSRDLATLINITQLTQTVGLTVTLQRGGVITGVVRDANTSQPIPNVQIGLNSDVPSIVFPSSNFKVFVTTDAAGVYTATGLPSGHYAAGIGVTSLYNGQVYSDHDIITQTVAGNSITVTAPLTVTNINFPLHRFFTGTLAGRVTDAQGHGIGFVQVLFHQAGSPSGLGRVDGSTDVNGYFTTTVTTRDYTVEFKRNTTYLCGGCFNDQFYMGPGQSTPTVVQVASGGLLSGLNATLLCGAPLTQILLYLPVVRR